MKEDLVLLWKYDRLAFYLNTAYVLVVGPLLTLLILASDHVVLALPTLVLVVLFWGFLRTSLEQDVASARHIHQELMDRGEDDESR